MTSRTINAAILVDLVDMFGILSNLVRIKPTHPYFFCIFPSLERLIFRNEPKSLSAVERWPFLFRKSTNMASDRDFCDVIASDLYDKSYRIDELLCVTF